MRVVNRKYLPFTALAADEPKKRNNLEPDLLAADQSEKLQRCLTTRDLVSLGVGSCVGTGMYLVYDPSVRTDAHSHHNIVHSFPLLLANRLSHYNFCNNYKSNMRLMFVPNT
ncbi:unnamed protein product [Medioppia subpectinata]|uniref:Uncharacterized protein n=1 Tax=Medioppia subpectinata TaxID=1979941 RepID=A0A7R9KJ56_9ACAR|nr:unnamed protein product [Medioppia subpectinata]CAG2104227.1 unnamed protein product [Medioppia subpectinata]